MRPKKKKFLIDLAWNYLLFSGSSRKKLLQQLLVCTCIRMLVRNWAASRLTERQTRHKETRKENQILYIAYFFKFKYLVSHFGKSRAASSLENVGGDGREKNLGKGGGGGCIKKWQSLLTLRTSLFWGKAMILFAIGCYVCFPILPLSKTHSKRTRWSTIYVYYPSTPPWVRASEPCVCVCENYKHYFLCFQALPSRGMVFFTSNCGLPVTCSEPLFT